MERVQGFQGSNSQLSEKVVGVVEVAGGDEANNEGSVMEQGGTCPQEESR